jgi:hypothetical protein
VSAAPGAYETRSDPVKTGPSRRRPGWQGVRGIPSGDQRDPGGQAHSAGGDGSMRADSRSAPHDDTAARSTGARDNTTRRSRKAPSTGRTSAGTGRRRPAAACPNILRANGQDDRNGGMLTASHVPTEEPFVAPSPGRAATRRGFSFVGRDDTQFLRRREDAASPRMMMWGSVRGRHVRMPRFSTAVHRRSASAFTPR